MPVPNGQITTTKIMQGVVPDAEETKEEEKKEE